MVTYQFFDSFQVQCSMFEQVTTMGEGKSVFTLMRSIRWRLNLPEFIHRLSSPESQVNEAEYLHWPIMCSLWRCEHLQIDVSPNASRQVREASMGITSSIQPILRAFWWSYHVSRRLPRLFGSKGAVDETEHLHWPILRSIWWRYYSPLRLYSILHEGLQICQAKADQTSRCW